MCAILGLIQKRTVAAAQFKHALDTMGHRGPDDEGVEHLPQSDGSQVWLGHKRLSILDLSPRGHQPMCDPQRRYWIVFNGEIYNFREVRSQLEQKGCVFRSDCDTEVILAAYEVWGEQCLEKLNGMFAFAIWDNRDKTLWMARDRLGVKPLYYVELPDGIAFASEIKALVQLPGVPREFNPEALSRYLTFLFVPEPDTLFRGIKKVPVGHELLWRDGNLRLTEWWDVPLTGSNHKSEHECEQDIVRLLSDSVRARMVSDVPLGVFLSGGLDSSVILAMMRRNTQDAIIAYTVGFRKQDLALDVIPDDVRFSRLMAQRMQPLDYNQIELAPSGFEYWPKLVWHLDEPIPDPAAMSTYLICREAKHKATVMEAGIGGEELFGGYPRYRAVKLANYYRSAPRLLRNLVRATTAPMRVAGTHKMNATLRNLKKFLRSAELPLEESYLGFLSFYTPSELERLLGRTVTRDEVYGRHEALLQRAHAMEPLNRISYLDLKTYLPGLNLTYSDKCGMASSVEVREPLLDYKLVELALTMPANYKIHGLEQKYIFKRAALPLVPREIVYRKKAGFSGPVRAWIKKDYRKEVVEILSDKKFRDRGLFDPDYIREIYDANMQGYEDYGLRIWSFVTLELWFETFIDRNGERPMS